MNRRQYLATLSLATAGLAGCTAPAGSEPTDQRVAVTFRNDSDRQLLFTAVAVAEGFGGVELSGPDGEETFPAAETVDDVPAETWERAVTFRPLGDAQRREFRSTGGSGTGIEFEPMPAGSTVVTTVAAPDAEPPMLSIGSGTRGVAEEAAIEVAVDAAGTVHQSIHCPDT
ncbi:MAG: hypothetical protein ACOCSD_02285, partial [Halolamina sp.]